MSGTRWMTRAEMDTLIDLRAQKMLGISGKEFINNLDAGEYKHMDWDSRPGLMELFMLAQTGRPIKSPVRGSGLR